jgi:ATP-dependent Clp protease ATP-binding subunit ClpC
MEFWHFSDGFRKALILPNDEASRLGREYIGTEHILLGLVEEKGAAADVLKTPV